MISHWRALLLIASAVPFGACAVPASLPVSSPPVPAGSPPFRPAGTFASRILAAHNVERKRVGASPLIWDSSLAAGASAYAQQLALTGAFRHSDRRARAGVGENLWMGTVGAFTPEQMVSDWASEKRWFTAGIFPQVSRTGRWSDVGHYSQMVWRTTTRVGCAVAPGRGHEVLVCRYAPAGNIDGYRVL